MAAVLVVSRYPSVRLGLRAMLESTAGVEVLADAADLSGIPNGIDAILLDYDEDLFDAVIRDAQTLLPIVVLGGPPDLVNCLATLPIFGWSLLRRDANVEEIAAALQVVDHGYAVLEPRNIRRIGNPLRSADLQPLSERERQVLQLIAEGMTNKQIANRLAISVHTVKFHVAAILEKLGVASRAEAVSAGIRGGAVHI